MRYYDPAAGRFTQQDSLEVLGDPGRGNRYQYAGDNPINYIDPTGKISFLTGVIIGLTVVSFFTGVGAVIAVGEFATYALTTVSLGTAFVGGVFGITCAFVPENC